MSQITVTISIGRTYGQECPHTRGLEMGLTRWTAFQATVKAALVDTHAAIYVDGAKSTGEWVGKAEESRTWVASTGTEWLENLRVDLESACRRFGQDSIALTVGHTELVTGA